MASNAVLTAVEVRRSRRSLTPLLLVVLYALALAVRYPLLAHITPDSKNYLLPWYDYIVTHGGYRALGQGFSNYTPPYLYLLVAVTYLPAAVPKLVAIKAISIIGDGMAALVMYRLVRLHYPKGVVPVLAFAAVLFAPTVVINGAYWGQCDILYATCLLASVLCASRERFFLAVLLFALGFAFKAQAIFFAPFIVVLWLKRRIPWSYVLLVPLVYLVMVLPCLLLGRPLVDLLLIYARQGDTYDQLSMNAPNFYMFIDNRFYAQVVPLGLAGAAVVGLALAGLPALSRFELDRRRLVQVAAFAVAVMPFVLPKMHDRYFFPADLLTIALAFVRPQLWFVPLMVQASSLGGYVPFLFNKHKDTVRQGAWINTVVIAILIVDYLHAWFARTIPGQAVPERMV